MKNVFFVFIFCCVILVSGQTPFLETISIEQGLSQGFVPSITQDEDGFLWFATKNGLNRYDGYQFKVFRNDPFDSNSINHDEIVVVEAVGDFLFLITSASRPMLFHRKTQRFFEVNNLPPMHKGSIIFFTIPQIHQIIASFQISNSHELIAISWPQHLDSLLIATPGIQNINEFLTITQKPIPVGKNFLGVVQDSETLFFYSKNRFIRQNIVTGAESFLDISASLAEQISNDVRVVYKIIESQGKTMIFTNESIIVATDKKTELFPYKVAPQNIFYYQKANSLLWYVVNNQVYGLKTNAVDFSANPSITINADRLIRSVYADKSGLIWMGTDAFGIRKYNRRSGIFKNSLEGYSIFSKPLYDDERFILVTEARQGSGYSKLIDQQTNLVKDISYLKNGWIISTEIPAVLGGYFWRCESFGSDPESRLVKLDPKTLQQNIYEMPGGIAKVVPALWTEQHEGKIWVVSSNAIASFNLNTSSFDMWQINDEPAERCYAVERDKKGNFWVGTEYGLIKISQLPNGTWKFSRLTAEKDNPNSLPTSFIKSLQFDPVYPGILWIGTNGKGLCRYDTDSGSMEIFDQKSSTLPDDVVYGILTDDAKPHNLWISTNKGLTRFNPETGFLQHFTRNDGLQENEFNTFASFKSPDGRLFFGGINGLTTFNPKELTVNDKPPSLWFTAITINGSGISPRDSGSIIFKDIAYLKNIELPHNKNNLAFSFAIMDFASPEKNSFFYYLEGAEEPWIHRGFNHSAQYLNLAPGKYTFWVNGVSSNGIYAEKPISLNIRILTPWYLSWPAWVIYSLLFILAGFLFNQYQLIQRLKTAEAKRLKNLDQFKTRFYTNITHEFRTPLTVILGITGQLINKAKENAHPLSLIKRNGENLLQLINQILDLTRLESHELRINYVQGDVLAFLKYISESLHSLANAQNVMLKVEGSHTKIVMDYDPERLRQIIHNLLSNAIKFTPSGGKVVMNIIFNDKELLIHISDTGIGIPQEMQSFLFDRFFQVKAHGALSSEKFMEKAGNLGSSGIGLSLTRELVQIMGGSITVESPRSDGLPGTVFTVVLPVTNKAPMEKESLLVSTNNYTLKETDKENLPEQDAKILLIEDNPDVMEYLASCLDEHYQLAFAYNGRVGIETALELIPDLIISDVMMPEKDGLEVCDFLKNDQRTSHIPIILLTAKVTLDDRLAGLRRGADVYLNKPFHEEELLVWIEQLIARQQRLKLRYANLGIDPKATPAESQPEALVLEDNFVSRLKNILEENYQNPEFSVDDIILKMGMSRAQLYRKLKSLTGKTVSAHLNTIRLEKSKILLKQGNLNISEVAYQVGYNDPKYFGRLFVEAFGQTPGEFAAES